MTKLPTWQLLVRLSQRSAKEDFNIDKYGVRLLYFAAGLGHLEAVKLLLTAGADVDLSFNPQSVTHRFTQGCSYIDAVNNNGKTSLIAAIKNRNNDMIYLLLRYKADKESRDRPGATALSYGPLTTTRTQIHGPVFTQLHAPKHNRDKIIASYGYQATVVDFFIGRSFEYWMEKKFMTLTFSQNLMRRYMGETNPVSQILSKAFKSSAGLSEGRNRLYFTAMTLLSYVGLDGGDFTQENIVAFVLYLHFETHNKYEAMIFIIKIGLQSNTRYLITRSPGKRPYFCTHLDTLERDMDQVVYRTDTTITCAAASIDSRTGDVASTSPIAPKVNDIPEPDGKKVQSIKPKAQASWIRNRNTKRTRNWVAELALSFQQTKPPRHGEPDWAGDVSEDTEDYKSTDLATRELASVITNHFANIFDHYDIPSDYQFFDIFERSIRRVWRRSKKQLSIEVEAGLLVEIEDIHDELIILECGVLDPPDYDPNHNFYGEYLSLKGNRLLGTHLQRIETMENMTRKTNKIKQATTAEALSTAEQSTRQGRTLMLFTVVTILFLPLSFMAAFFAINIHVFPVNENDKLELSYVLKYMLSISAGLSVLFIIVALNQERFFACLRYARPRFSSGYILLAAVLTLMGGILAALWTSPLEYTSKLRATIATLLLTFILFMIAKQGFSVTLV
ncbi:hypothetical protein F5X96DRAFT_680423 [Biscogniauxia mediterranea]|nr:hypothetical protein F5X96DRAFT_680423 [Biscogniauxia mediterranea]